jgi:hypothetical protein
VLRITVQKDKDRPVFMIEGRLTGDWVGELLRVTRELLPGTNCVFDIEDVLFVDLLGERALQWLNHLGATFAVRNAYGVDLCERLHLRRYAGEADGGLDRDGKRSNKEI